MCRETRVLIAELGDHKVESDGYLCLVTENKKPLISTFSSVFGGKEGLIDINDNNVFKIADECEFLIACGDLASPITNPIGEFQFGYEDDWYVKQDDVSIHYHKLGFHLKHNERNLFINSPRLEFDAEQEQSKRMITLYKKLI